MISQSIYFTEPGTTKLIRRNGPIPPREAAVVFIADAPVDYGQVEYIGCPDGVTPALLEELGLMQSEIGKAFHLTSNAPIGVSMTYPFGGARSYLPTGLLVPPVPSWGTEHVAVTAWERGITFAYSPILQLYVAEDDTEIEIKARAAITNGKGFTGVRAGDTFKITLNRGEVLQFAQDEDLTGSLIA
jgi:hypothetical protein